uniref:HMG box domain-containing protein n=1 Tax=Haptolina brevifila TaxID=156173 RepID=A0A7S2J9E8_9EUKA|mmetsp:Transcript_78691/g.156469  ORF Transcript_78691/g.156469 Transcript_78691/m.156469 type:complete len:168 (+) Transcript_78691:73-576(+)|eukprot:CAMPEP_0174719904 /NCGR_PEP_ID=MMETSP1094-20130205/32292_1 /TAXON_ID=156173 /ORGANISM="Chrysochromulina brevifilum, Strain UTEX LB 985" /LENGTH=167 /DNA_ID=CAMNT_0015920299 /DNA_START=73 /DNA_END=576 /DNA_ORIENTATION=-
MASAAVRAVLQASLKKVSDRKAAVSAYICFGHAMRAKTPEVTMKELGAQWKALNAISKAPYEKEAADKKAASEAQEPVARGWVLKKKLSDEQLEIFADKIAEAAIKAFLREQIARADQGITEQTSVKSVGSIVSSILSEGKPLKHPKVSMLIKPVPSARSVGAEHEV